MIEHPVGIEPATAELRAALSAEHRGALGRPLDDMWRTFAEQAPACTLKSPPETVVGYYSLDEELQLREFYLRPSGRGRAAGTFAQVLEHSGAVAALPTTFDELFTTLAMDAAQSLEPKAFLYELGGEALAPSAPLESLRVAGEADFKRAVAFEAAATGAPLAFLEHYVGARIAGGELLLHEVAGELQAVGELRVDATDPSYLQLGVIVGEAQRRQGLASAIMSYLVSEAAKQNKTPICSTDPENLGAQRAIERAGFRQTAQVLRTTFVSGVTEGAEDELVAPI